MEETLVSRRSRRSTAGNRMEMALAELMLEDPQQVEEDLDFVVDKEEEDVFESDFASTDEEAPQEDVDEGDQAAREEERRDRKTARARVEKATAVAHARQRVTFNPDAATQTRTKPQRPKRRVSLGTAVNAETGQVIESSTTTLGVKRQSQRRHTIMNTSATVNRIKDAEEKRAAIPKKTKIASRLPTQDELIARALDTEEGNIIEHKDYLRLEEEKRAKARVVKQAIQGPVLRWISKKETVQVEVQLPPPPPPMTTTTTSANMYAANFNFVYTPGAGSGTVGSQAYSMPFYAYTPYTAQRLGPTSQQASTSTTTSSYSTSKPVIPDRVASTTISSDSSGPAWQQQPHRPQTQLQTQSSAQTASSAQPQSYPSSFFSYPAIPAPPLIVHRSEDVCKNYVVHEFSQSVPSKPSWKDTMTALFGDHVRWDEVRVFTSKGRPLARPVRTCPITGQPAKYRDPRTNVPFANIGAYDVLTSMLGREYAWSSPLGCYVGMSGTMQKSSGSAHTSAAEGRRGDGNDEHEVEEVEERIIKRPRVENDLQRGTESTYDACRKI